MLTSNFKKLVFLTCCISISAASFAQDFHIQVKLKNLSHCKVLLSYPNDKQFIIDTGRRSTDGTINFVGKLDAPVIAGLQVLNPALDIKSKNNIVISPSLELVLNNEDIIINGDANTIYSFNVSGKSNQAWSSIRTEEAKLIRNWWEALKSSYEQDTKSAKQNLERVGAEKDQGLQDIRTKNIRNYPDAFSSVYFLYSMSDQLKPDTFEALFSKLSIQLKQSIFGRAIAQKIMHQKVLAKGAPALPINKMDIAGNLVDLNNFLGNYILLDFWGSWCKPCRESHPQLIELYNKYKSKGFVIIGIAKEHEETLTANEASWKGAIEADKLPWIQILNNQDEQRNDIIKAYGITSFPFKLLIDKKGKIIASFSGSDEKDLEKTLDTIFDNH